MKTKSALSYFGSDSEVAEDLAAMLEHCRHVTILMVGGASIIPWIKARAIVANDLHDAAINFYRVISGWYGKDMRAEVINRCQHTLSHPSDLEIAQRTMELGLTDHVEKAWAFWAICWIGRKGKGGTKDQGGMPSVRRNANGGTNASRIRSAAQDLERWAKEFERCEWECKCFRRLLPDVADRKDCGIYADPPWIGVGDGYLHSFSRQDHEDLRSELERFEETTVVVRYGDDPLIRELYRGWHILERHSKNQANKSISEIWITNKAK